MEQSPRKLERGQFETLIRMGNPDTYRAFADMNDEEASKLMQGLGYEMEMPEGEMGMEEIVEEVPAEQPETVDVYVAKISDVDTSALGEVEVAEIEDTLAEAQTFMERQATLLAKLQDLAAKYAPSEEVVAEEVVEAPLA